MVGIVIAFPQMVLVYKDDAVKFDPAKVKIEIPMIDMPGAPIEIPGAPAPGSAPATPSGEAGGAIDPVRAIEEMTRQEATEDPAAAIERALQQEGGAQKQ